MERYKDLNTQLKLAKVFKAVISAGLVAPVFVSVSACEKAKPVVEEAQATATIPTTQETTPPTTQETVSPTTETTPETTAEVIINAPAIEGLKFDNSTKTYFAEAGNPYGLEAGVEAGIYVKDAIEINGKMEDSVGLDPKIIEYKQNEIYKETKEYLCPIVFPLNEVKGIKIKEMDVEPKIEGDHTSLGIELPPDTNFSIPASGEWLFYPGGEGLTEYDVLIFQYDVGVKDRIGQIEMDFKGVNIIKDMEKEEKTIFNNENPEGIKITVGNDTLKLGEVFGTNIGNDYLGKFNNESDNIKFKEPGLYQFGLILIKDSPLKGAEKLLSIKKDNKEIKIFIFNNSQKTAHAQTN